jgi:hypothetical protein
MFHCGSRCSGGAAGSGRLCILLSTALIVNWSALWSVVNSRQSKGMATGALGRARKE